MLSTGAVEAQSASGELWHVPEATANSAVVANIPSSTPDVTFDVNSPLNFNAPTADVGTWLASGSAFNIVANTAGVLTTPMDDGTTGTLVKLSGFLTVANGQTFTVTHDDGVTLIINGINLGFLTTATPPLTEMETYSGPPGTFPFELVYAECCGGDAELEGVLPLTFGVPEPNLSLGLLGPSVVGLILIGRLQPVRDLDKV
jgi:hypothetical protein